MKNEKSILNTLIIVIILLSINSYSQQNSNRVNAIGVSFVIPTGWVGQETQTGYLLKSNTVAGFILISKNNTTDINTMIYEAQQGFVTNDSNYLKMIGQVENFNNTGIGATYQGVMEGIPAKAYMVSVLNTIGLGVSIMAATTTEYYSSAYRQLCIDIASSVQQIQATATSTNQIQQTSHRSIKNKTEKLFAGARLTYHDTGDGYATKIVISLCEQGFFNHSNYSSMAADTDTVSAGYGENSRGSGQWYIIEKNNQLPILHLQFYNGEVHEYYITLQDGRTYLNDYRYYRTYGEDGAWCD